jgi:hypothetical protein
MYHRRAYVRRADRAESLAAVGTAEQATIVDRFSGERLDYDAARAYRP